MSRERTSRLVERAVRRQRAIQHSRSAVLMGFIGMLAIALLALASLVISAAGGTLFSLSALASLIILMGASWLAGHLLTEARRLGKLLRDSDLILRSEQNPELAEGAHWRSLNPFSGWRD